MVNVAQLVRALVCGTGGREFNPLHSHQFELVEERCLLIQRNTGGVQ